MRIINTSSHLPSDIPSQTERDWVYNGLDCAVTLEVLDQLLPQLDNQSSATYSFSRDLQGPVLEMNLRGCLVDQQRKQQVIEEFSQNMDFLERNLDKIVLDGVGMYGFNWGSNEDLKTLFYEKLKIPVILKGGRPTVDRGALEKMEAYLIARPIITHLTALRDLRKKIGVLKAGIDPDGRYRTSYNIAATSTGRFSSSYSEFGTGGNLQNVEETLRSVFISDKGYKFAKFDAKSGESFVVGAIEWNLFKDSKYLDACETGDPHTAVARICWPNLSWTGVLKKDKEVAESPYYRHYTYRFMCKKLGHGSNYGGKPTTLAQQTRLPVTVVAEFQPQYFKAFPAHPEWQSWVKNELFKSGNLTTLTGRRRWFFGRRNSEDTLREAIAYDPQGSLADIVNTAMLRIWRERTAILMFQDHDALTFMYPEEREDEVVPTLHAMLPQRIELRYGRELVIPYDCKTGWNRGDYDAKKNPDGLKEFEGHDERRRSPTVGLLDRRIRRSYR